MEDIRRSVEDSRNDDVKMVQTSPSVHGNLSQQPVAEGHGIAFATARKRDDPLRKKLSFFLKKAAADGRNLDVRRRLPRVNCWTRSVVDKPI